MTLAILQHFISAQRARQKTFIIQRFEQNIYFSEEGNRMHVSLVCGRVTPPITGSDPSEWLLYNIRVVWWWLDLVPLIVAKFAYGKQHCSLVLRGRVNWWILDLVLIGLLCYLLVWFIVLNCQISEVIKFAMEYGDLPHTLSR